MCIRDRQQADARVLLLRKLIRPQAPQVPKRKITRTVQICILAVMAALAQEQRPAKGPAKACGKQWCGIRGAIVIYLSLIHIWTVPIGSMAKTENFSVFPVPKAAR